MKQVTVLACVDCPMAGMDRDWTDRWVCMHPGARHRIDLAKAPPAECPLRSESITIRLHERVADKRMEDDER